MMKADPKTLAAAEAALKRVNVPRVAAAVVPA